MSYAGVSGNVLDAFEQANWNISEGITKLSDNVFLAEFFPTIRPYLQEALKANNIDMFSGFTFDGSNESLLEALKEKQDEIVSLTENKDNFDSFNYDTDDDLDIEDSFDILNDRQAEYEFQYSKNNPEINEDIIEFSENFQYLIDSIDDAVNNVNSIDENIIDSESENIEIRDYEGTWHTIDSIERDGKQYFLMQSEQYGDEVYKVVLDSEGYLIVENIDGAFNKDVLDAIDTFNGRAIDVIEIAKGHEENITEEIVYNEPLINSESKDIIIGDYVDTWHTIDSFKYNDSNYFLMENDASVDGDLYNVLLNEDGDVIVENINNEINDDVLDAIDAYDGQPIDMLNRIEVNENEYANDNILQFAQGSHIQYEQSNDGQFSLFNLFDNPEMIADNIPSDINSNISDSFEELKNDISNMMNKDEHKQEHQPTKLHNNPEL